MIYRPPKCQREKNCDTHLNLARSEVSGIFTTHFWNLHNCVKINISEICLIIKWPDSVESRISFATISRPISTDYVFTP